MSNERRVTTADGVQLAVAEDGEGPPLLLIQGLGATRHIFAPLLPHLARRHRVITYDPRGLGDSEGVPPHTSMRGMADDARTVLAASASVPADVFGASMGGVVAQQLAVDHGDEIRKLVLAATSPGGSKAVPPDPRAMAALLGRGARTPADAYRIACTVLYSSHFLRTHSDFIEEQVALRAAHPVRAQVFSAQLNALQHTDDLALRLGELRMPVLVLHGTADAVTPFENAQVLAARIPAATTRWFADCGHLFFHERPQESARVIDEFLRE
jgi:3-oxoadipate enol-lactonase